MLSLQSVAAIFICGVALSQTGTGQTGNTQPGPLTGLAPDHATISVENIDRVAEWYERVLGFKVANRFDTNPDFILEQLSIPGYRIDLAKSKGSARPAAPNPVFQHGHDVCVDDDKNLYVCQWNANHTAPVKLTRV